MTRGVRDEQHPNRRVGRDDWGGGEFPGQTPTSPPLSETSGRGTLIDPLDADYQEIGNTGRYRTPDRSMTVGVRSATEPSRPPLSEQPERGVLSRNAATVFFQENQPQFTDSYGPAAEVLNSTQWTPS